MTLLSELSESDYNDIISRLNVAIEKIQLTPSEEKQVQSGDFGFELIADFVQETLYEYGIDFVDDDGNFDYDDWDLFLDENEYELLHRFIESHNFNYRRHEASGLSADF